MFSDGTASKKMRQSFWQLREKAVESISIAAFRKTHIRDTAAEYSPAPRASSSGSITSQQSATQQDADEAEAHRSDQEFIPTKKFDGPKPGMAFKKGSAGLGYYKVDDTSRLRTAASSDRLADHPQLTRQTTFVDETATPHLTRQDTFVDEATDPHWTQQDSYTVAGAASMAASSLPMSKAFAVADSTGEPGSALSREEKVLELIRDGEDTSTDVAATEEATPADTQGVPGKAPPLLRTRAINFDEQVDGALAQSTGGFPERQADVEQSLAKSESAPASLDRPPDSVRKTHWQLLHEAHQKKLDRLQKERDDQDDKRRQTFRMLEYKVHTKFSPRGRDVAHQPVHERLYKEAEEFSTLLEIRKKRFEDEEKARIADETLRQRPTKGRSRPASSSLSSADAHSRLYRLAEERRYIRQLEQDMARMEFRKNDAKVKGIDAKAASKKFSDLYLDASARAKRREERGEKRLQEETEELKRQTAPYVDAKRGVNMEKILCLYDEGKQREEKIKEMQWAAQTAAEEALEIEIQKARASRHRAGDLPDFYEERKTLLVKNPDGKVKQTEVKEKQKLSMRKRPRNSKAVVSRSSVNSSRSMVQARSALLAIQAAISWRCGYRWPKTNKAVNSELSGLLKQVIDKYQIAVDQLHADPGLPSLRRLASLRFFQQRLIPEFEGRTGRLQPDSIRQVEDDIERILQSATEAHDLLKAEIAPEESWTSSDICTQSPLVPSALWVHDPGLKTRESVENEALLRYGPSEGKLRHRHMVNICIFLFAFASCSALKAGLNSILQSFEAVEVRNFFSNPDRLGRCYIQVLVVVLLCGGEGRTCPVPHVCEMRLELVTLHEASTKAGSQLQEFCKKLHTQHSSTLMEISTVTCAVGDILSRVATSQRLREFRTCLAHRFGSTICAWRRLLSDGGRFLNFDRFRDVCNMLNYSGDVTELWQGLDAGRSGCISLWELDPDSCALLVKFRARAIAAVDASEDHVTASEVIAKLDFLGSGPHTTVDREGCIDFFEFRLAAHQLGFSTREAKQCFACLAQQGGIKQEGAMFVKTADIEWLKRLPSLIDINAVACFVAYEGLKHGKSLRPSSPTMEAASENANEKEASESANESLRPSSTTMDAASENANEKAASESANENMSDAEATASSHSTEHGASTPLAMKIRKQMLEEQVKSLEQTLEKRDSEINDLRTFPPQAQEERPSIDQDTQPSTEAAQEAGLERSSTELAAAPADVTSEPKFQSGGGERPQNRIKDSKEKRRNKSTYLAARLRDPN